MGIYTGHNPSSQDDIDRDSVSQNQIEVMNNELDSIYVMVEELLKQVKQNTQIINNMMECIAKYNGTSIGQIFYDYPVQNNLRRKQI